MRTFKNTNLSESSFNILGFVVEIWKSMTMTQESTKAIKRDIAPILASSMDGPTIKWTVADSTKVNNKLFMTYHVMSSGYDFLTPLGCLFGAVGLPSTSKFSNLSRLQAAGTGGLIAGGTGMAMGLLAMTMTAYAKEPRYPWDEDGIQMRVDGISRNYFVRSMDLGVCLGIAAAGASLAYAGGPATLGLSAGTFGRLQAVALGSAMGSVGASIYVNATK
jgi:hypothetical protein